MSEAVDETTELLRAQYRASNSLQAEFVEEEVFVAYARHEKRARDRKRGYSARPSVTASDVENWRAEWDRDAAVRDEFCNCFDAFCGYRRAEREGRVKQYGGRR